MGKFATSVDLHPAVDSGPDWDDHPCNVATMLKATGSKGVPRLIPDLSMAVMAIGADRDIISATGDA
jgi:hypothetical protein